MPHDEVANFGIDQSNTGGEIGSHTIDQALLLFGRPKSVTGFLRALRGVESEVDDTFTIILQYGPPQQDLLVTIKTNIVSPMPDQLKYFVRGTKGTFVKVSLEASQPCLASHPYSLGYTLRCTFTLSRSQVLITDTLQPPHYL